MNFLRGRSCQASRFWTIFSCFLVAISSFFAAPAQSDESADSNLSASAVIIPGSATEQLYLSGAKECYLEENSRRSTGFFEYRINFSGKAPILLEVETSGSLVVEASTADGQLTQLFESGMIDEDISVKMKRQLRIDMEITPPLVVRFSKKKGSQRPFALWRMYVRRGLDIFTGSPTESLMLLDPGASQMLKSGGRYIPANSGVSYALTDKGSFFIMIECEGKFSAELKKDGKFIPISLSKLEDAYYGYAMAEDITNSLFVKAIEKDARLIRVSYWNGLNCVDFVSDIASVVCSRKSEKYGLRLTQEAIKILLPPHKDSLFWMWCDSPESVAIDTVGTYIFGNAVIGKISASTTELSIKGTGMAWAWGVDTDADEDKLPSTVEYAIGTDPNRVYTDFDEIGDFEDLMPTDSDNDGLMDSVENFLQFNPSYHDTNSDSWPDGLGLADFKLSNLSVRTSLLPVPGAAYHDATDEHVANMAYRFGPTYLVVPFGKLLAEKDPLIQLRKHFEKAQGLEGVMLDNCSIALADMETPHLKDAFQIWAKRLWGSAENDDNLAYKFGEFCNYRINFYLDECQKMADESGLKIAVSIPSPSNSDISITPYLDLKKYARVQLDTMPFSTDRAAFYSGLRDTYAIGRPVFVGIDDERGTRAYLTGARTSGNFVGCAVTKSRPIIVSSNPAVSNPSLVQVFTNSTFWASKLDFANTHPNWTSTLADSDIMLVPSSVENLAAAKFAMLDEGTTFPNAEQTRAVSNWISGGGSMLFVQSPTRFKSETPWGPRTTLGRNICREFNIFDAQLGTVYKAGSGNIMLYDGSPQTGLKLMFDQLRVDLPKPPCSFCEAAHDQVETTYMFNRFVEKGQFPKSEFPVAVDIDHSKAPYSIASTCSVPWIEKRGTKIRVIAQAQKGACSTISLALGGEPQSVTSSSTFSSSYQNGVTTISFAGTGGGNAFVMDLSESLDIEAKKVTVIPSSPLEGEAVTVHGFLSNNSSIPSGAVSVTFHWNKPDRQTQFKRLTYDVLSPRQTKEISFLAPLPPGNGEMAVYMVVESDNELDKKNNTASSKFTVKAKPKFKTIVMQVGSKQATVNGVPQTITSPPFQQKNGKVMVPFRFLAESLGATVAWDSQDKRITFIKGKQTIYLWIGRNYAIVDGKMANLDTPPVISNGSTFVPVRFVSEQLGAAVTWDQKSKIVTIKIGL